MLNQTGTDCIRCLGYPTETTSVAGGKCVCAPGFFLNSIKNLNNFAVHNLSEHDDKTHPFSSLYRSTLALYLYEYPELKTGKIRYISKVLNKVFENTNHIHICR